MNGKVFVQTVNHYLSISPAFKVSGKVFVQTDKHYLSISPATNLTLNYSLLFFFKIYQQFSKKKLLFQLEEQ
jgi:hypothetical protein